MTEQPSRLQNLYIARLTTQERPCFVCSKFTSVVLTSADNSNADWFYICRAHLGDFNFCSKIGGSPKPAPKSPTKKEATLVDRPAESDSVVDLVSSIGSAWKSWRGTKKEGEEDKKEDKKEEGKKEEEKKEGKKEEDEDKEETSSTSTTPNLVPTSPITSSAPTQPIRFVIQRDYFYLRQREFMKKAQKKEANEKLKTLKFPEVPKTIPTLK